MNLPNTIGDLTNFITAQVQESIHLDYKASPAVDKSKTVEIAKDVSAFANSDGGMLIYGITESNNLPISLDGGVDHTTHSREWLEQVINSNISPRIDGIRIAPIQISATRSYYAVDIPKSFRGPHQCSDKKYYKRFNFTSVPMEDFEIADVRNRRTVLPPLISIDVEIDPDLFVYLSITNIGDQNAEAISFELSPELKRWIEREGPNLFTRGIRVLGPKKHHRISYGHINAALEDNSDLASEFDIATSYLHPMAGHRITEKFHFDLMDYWNTSLGSSEIVRLATRVQNSIDRLTATVEHLNANVQSLTPLSSSTGLDLSVGTIRNLQHLVANESRTEQIHPEGATSRVFMEVLGVDSNTALHLRNFFRLPGRDQYLEDVEGVTPELLERISQSFHVEPYLRLKRKNQFSSANRSTQRFQFVLLTAAAVAAILLVRPR